MYLHFPLHLVQVAFGIALTGLIGVLTGTSHSETSQESSNDEFIVKFFWVTGGLILCFNAFIKLVNTPVKGGNMKEFKISFFFLLKKEQSSSQIIYHLYIKNS